MDNSGSPPQTRFNIDYERASIRAHRKIKLASLSILKRGEGGKYPSYIRIVFLDGCCLASGFRDLLIFEFLDF
jgi:hypothetical protein